MGVIMTDDKETSGRVEGCVIMVYLQDREATNLSAAQLFLFI